MTQQTTSDLKEIFNSQITGWVKTVLGIIVFVFGIVAPFYDMRQDIALTQQSIRTIETNHEQHIQDISQDLKEQKQQIIELQRQLIIITSR